MSAAAPPTDFQARPSVWLGSAGSERESRNCSRLGARAACALPHPRRHGGRLSNAAAGIGRRVVHVVLTRETRYMFGEAQLKLMKPNAIVLNTACGKVVDETALARAIAEGRIRGAAIDAFEEEPLPVDSPLRKLGDRVLLSPHSASYTEGGELRQGGA